MVKTRKNLKKMLNILNNILDMAHIESGKYKVIIDKLQKDLSAISPSESNEMTYIKQVISLLQASHDISSIDNKCVKSEVVKKTSKNEITNTEAYISRLKTLESTLK